MYGQRWTNKKGYKMKNLKKIYLAALLLLPVNVFAAGMVGTGVLADSFGLVNVYYQHKLSKTSGVSVGYASLSGDYLDANIKLTSFAVSYKGYFSNYANGGYWQLGAASLNVTLNSGSLGSGLVSGSQTIPVVLVGYESTIGSNFVVGIEAGLGTNQGLGILGVNAAYMF